MNSNTNTAADHLRAERQWKAIDELIDEEIISIEELSRIWSKPVAELVRWKEEIRVLPNDLEKNLILRFRVSALWLWKGDKPILITTENNELND